MKLSEKIQEALRQQQEINLSDPAVQKRLAAQWGYVPADAQPVPSVPDLLESLRCACNYIDKLGGVSQQYRTMLASPEAKP
jgi:hypothetical protein